MPDDFNKTLRINGRDELVTWLGPVPLRNSLISLDDGRLLRVVEVCYKGRMVPTATTDRDAPHRVIINDVVIQARFV